MLSLLVSKSMLKSDTMNLKEVMDNESTNYWWDRNDF